MSEVRQGKPTDRPWQGQGQVPHTVSVLGKLKRRTSTIFAGGEPPCGSPDTAQQAPTPLHHRPSPASDPLYSTRSASQASQAAAAAQACLAAARQLRGSVTKERNLLKKGDAPDTGTDPGSAPTLQTEADPQNQSSPCAGPSAAPPSTIRSSRYASHRRGTCDGQDSSLGESSMHVSHPKTVEKPTPKTEATPRSSWLRLSTGSVSSGTNGRRVFVSDSDSSSSGEDDDVSSGRGRRTRGSKASMSETIFSRRRKRPSSPDDRIFLEAPGDGESVTGNEADAGNAATSPCASSWSSAASPLFGEHVVVRGEGLAERVRVLESAMQGAISRLDEQAKDLERERRSRETLSQQLKDCKNQLAVLYKQGKKRSTTEGDRLNGKRSKSSSSHGASSSSTGLVAHAEKACGERADKRKKEHRTPLSMRGNLLL